MASTRKLRVMAHIAPLIRDVDSCQSVTYNCTVEMEKNDLNTSLYDDIVAELEDYIISIDETSEHWILYLYDINTELYTSNYVNNLDVTDAEYAIKYLLNCSNRNLGAVLELDKNIYNVDTFISKCIGLLEWNFIPKQEEISEDELCPVCNRYHSCQHQYYYPADVSTYDNIKTYSDYALGLSSANKTALENYILHDNNIIDWTSVFTYQLDTGAVAPIKDDFGKVGFELTAVELKSSSGDFYTYKTGVTLIPPKFTDMSYHFEIISSSELIDAGYIVIYPQIIVNVNKIELLLQKIDPNASALSLPIVAAKFLLKQDSLFVPVETASTEIEYGPSN